MIGLGREGRIEGSNHRLQLFIQVAELSVQRFKPYPRFFCLIVLAIEINGRIRSLRTTKRSLIITRLRRGGKKRTDHLVAY
jgi:hypothetical protein